MRSLRLHFKEEAAMRQLQLQEKPESLEDDQEFEEISKINDEWNARIAQEREVRLQEQAEIRTQLVLAEIETKNEAAEQARERFSRRVERESVMQNSFRRWMIDLT